MNHRWNVEFKRIKSSKVEIYLPELANLELVAENIWYGSEKQKQYRKKVKKIYIITLNKLWNKKHPSQNK